MKHWNITINALQVEDAIQSCVHSLKLVLFTIVSTYP